MKHPKCVHSFEIVAELPPPLLPLKRLAANFRWTWSHDTRDLFREVDRELWEKVGHNPVQLIAQLSPERIKRLSTDSRFLAQLSECEKDLDAYLTEDRWFQKAHPESDLQVAYFCAEFGVSECLPIYSGGLGVLAGDHLKAASDLGLPLVGVGLLYARGYFRQFLTPDGWQQEHYPNYDFYQMPLALERGPDHQPLTIQVSFPDRNVTCQIWRAEVGRVKLYLLDSNVLENEAHDQGITDTLYGGDEEMRLRQEMILGIGGYRALEKVGVKPSVCHMNEGHAAFLSVERVRQFMREKGCDFRIARQVNVNGNVFTTHTPVPAGFDVFQPDVLKHYLGKETEGMNLPWSDFLKMGRFRPENENENFNMAVLAMENANYVNGVSALHGEVSRSMFHSRWPAYTEDETPIEGLVNGIHTETWTSARMSRLFDDHLGEGWREDPSNPDNWSRVWDIPDADLWSIRDNQRGDFVRFARKYLQEMAQTRGYGKGAFGHVESILDPRILTIGFARRFATYKRATLMLADRERLKSILFHSERPVQIVIAGKSHPRDDGGKKLIQDLVNFINHDGGRTRMVFLEDYDIHVARNLVQGVDVWLNNPRRPLEASGTSGMKVVPNGGLNCSILDGWWDEGYDPGVGWAIGDRLAVSDEGQQDWLDSKTLYHLIESEIAPTFYHRVDGSVPHEWVQMMKRSIAKLSPQFSTSRMVRDYAEKAYLPSNAAFRKLENNLGAAGEALIWRDRVSGAWDKISVRTATDDAGLTNSVGSSLRIQATVDLDGLAPDEVRVQAAMGKVGSNRDLVDVVFHDLEHQGGEGSIHQYVGTVHCDTPGNRGYTVRVVPKHAYVNVAHELPLVRWEGS